MPAYKEKDKDTWYVQFYYKDWTGQNRKKLKRSFRCKKDAIEWERNFILQQTCNLDMTFGDFWKLYEADVKPKLKLNTWVSKEYMVNYKILPYFKNKRMNDITVRDVIKWQNELRSMRDEKGNPYKGTYLKTLNAQLSAIFNHAVRFKSPDDKFVCPEITDNYISRSNQIKKDNADELIKEEVLISKPDFVQTYYMDDELDDKEQYEIEEDTFVYGERTKGDDY